MCMCTALHVGVCHSHMEKDRDVCAPKLFPGQPWFELVAGAGEAGVAAVLQGAYVRAVVAVCVHLCVRAASMIG